MENVVRICTWNLYQFCNCESPKEIEKVLIENNVSIAGFQEVPKKKLLKYLGEENCFFQGCPNDNFGNALWLNPAMKWKVRHHSGQIIGRNRAVQSVHLERENGTKLHVYNTHLDHEDEERRLEQLEKVFKFMSLEFDHLNKGKPFDLFFLGDFNALTFSDYDDVTLDKITLTRY